MKRALEVALTVPSHVHLAQVYIQVRERRVRQAKALSETPKVAQANLVAMSHLKYEIHWISSISRMMFLY